MEFYQNIHDGLQLFSFPLRVLRVTSSILVTLDEFIFPVWSWQDLSSIIPPGLYRTYRTLQLFSGLVGWEESNIRSRLCECLHNALAKCQTWCHDVIISLSPADKMSSRWERCVIWIPFLICSLATTLSRGQRFVRGRREATGER